MKNKSEDPFKVTFRIDEKLYYEYKIILLQHRTNTTRELVAHIKRVVATGNPETNNFESD